MTGVLEPESLNRSAYAGRGSRRAVPRASHPFLRDRRAGRFRCFIDPGRCYARRPNMVQTFSPLDGALLIDKPAGMTSHDVVDVIRRQFRDRKSTRLNSSHT